jgi:very-short-patch-repair endonuclease
MRRSATATERLLWKLLRDRRFEDLKFRRQVPVGPYIADFICYAHRLIVEADGPMHDAEADARRDAWLKHQGFTVLRFANSEISTWRDRVFDRVREVVGPAGAPSSGPPGHLLPRGEKAG